MKNTYLSQPKNYCRSLSKIISMEGSKGWLLMAQALTGYLTGKGSGSSRFHTWFFLLEITLVSALFGLNLTSHFSDQRCS
jgi:hypothetical protein